MPFATAFVVGYPVPGTKNEYVPLVITAKHVFDEHPTVLVRFNGKSGKGPIEVTCNRDELIKAGDYWQHPDKNVDLAVFRVPHHNDADYTPLPIDLVPSRKTLEDEDVKMTDRVVFPSLLVSLRADRNYPVVRDGSVALTPDEPYILLNAISIGGVSGAPVFLWPRTPSKEWLFRHRQFPAPSCRNNARLHVWRQSALRHGTRPAGTPQSGELRNCYGYPVLATSRSLGPRISEAASSTTDLKSAVRPRACRCPTSALPCRRNFGGAGS